MIELAYPWLLVLLPLPILLYLALPKGTALTSGALKIPFYEELLQSTDHAESDRVPFNLRLLMVSLVWILLVIASAKPQWLGTPIHLPRSGRDIMLAVDISGSMQIPDMSLNGSKVSRLQVVKKVAGEFISSRTGDRLGLILFGTKAYLQTPLTYDRKTVRTMLDDASIGLAGQETALGDAIGLSIKRLLKQPEKNRLLVLLTDGASNTGAVSPIAAAKLAAKYHIKIYTIGLGSDRMVITTFFGRQVLNPSRNLDEETLKIIAKTTGGLSFRARDTEGLQQIYDQIDKIEPTVTDQAVFRPITPLYEWPLGLAMFLSLMLLLRHINFYAMFHSRPREIVK